MYLIFAAALYGGGIAMVPTKESGALKFIVHKLAELELSQLFFFFFLLRF